VPSCCSPGSYVEIFGAKQARRDARKYRKKGLDPTARLLVEHAGEPEGATVLEVGGGVGAIGLELLKRGASHATNVELSPEYDEEAHELAREAGVEERVDRRVGDFARDGVPPADVVAMHRVVCCYPDYEQLLGTASDHTQRALVFSFPRETWWWRVVIGGLNALMRLRRREFRAFVHPVRSLLAVPVDHGLSLDFEHEGRIWRMAAFGRRVA
jgi:magnesium-protoporphyrin O-methyltransferase